jgi:hypothetical protein
MAQRGGGGRGGGRGGGGGGRGGMGGAGGRGGPPGRGEDGTPTPSPERVSRTEIRWIDLQLTTPPAPNGTGGETESANVEELTPIEHLLRQAMPQGIPALIYFSVDGKGTDREDMEAALYGDTKFAIASQLFRMIRVDMVSVKDEALVKKYGDPSNPVFVVADAEGKLAPSVKGWRTSATKLLRIMSGPVQKAYKIDLSQFLAKEDRYLEQIDQILAEIATKKQELIAALTNDSESARRKELTLSEQIADLEVKLEAVRKEEKEHAEAPLKKIPGATPDSSKAKEPLIKNF